MFSQGCCVAEGQGVSQSQIGGATSPFPSRESPRVTPDKWPSLLEGTRPYFSAGADTSVSCQMRVREPCPNAQEPGEGGCPGPCCFSNDGPVSSCLATCEIRRHPLVKMPEKVRSHVSRIRGRSQMWCNYNPTHHRSQIGTGGPRHKSLTFLPGPKTSAIWPTKKNEVSVAP